MNFVKKNSFLQMDPLNEKRVSPKRDYTKLKVKELKQECKKLGLKKFSSLKKRRIIPSITLSLSLGRRTPVFDEGSPIPSEE